MPSTVSIRSIHKHSNVKEGEVLFFENVTVPSEGSVQVMRPVKLTETTNLHPVHFFVENEGSLQSYEYTAYEVADVSNIRTFLVEFCHVVAERGLQRMFGLKINSGSDDQDKTGWTEVVFTVKRGTILIPDGMSKPDGAYMVSVSTEWGGTDNSNGMRGWPPKVRCKHCNHDCTEYSLSADDTIDEAFCLGGQKFLPG